MRSFIINPTRGSSPQLGPQVPLLIVFEAKRDHAEHTPAWPWAPRVQVELVQGVTDQPVVVLLVEDGLDEAELAVAHVEKLGT